LVAVGWQIAFPAARAAADHSAPLVFRRWAIQATCWHHAPPPSGLQAGGRTQLALLSQANQARLFEKYKGEGMTGDGFRFADGYSAEPATGFSKKRVAAFGWR